MRALFGVIFVAGGVSHLVLGRTQPESYEAFASTSLVPALTDLWHSFVLPLAVRPAPATPSPAQEGPN